MDTQYTVEGLLLDESFLDYCLNRNSIYKNKWEQIIVQYPDQVKTIEEAKELYFLLNPSLSPGEIATQVNKIREIILEQKKNDLPVSAVNAEAGESLVVDREGKMRGRRFRRMAVYSLVLASILSGVLYLVNTGIKTKPGKIESAKLIIYQNPRAERKQVELPDGSLAILNSNSQISITSDYNKKDRVVELSGNAFFKVEKNAGKPFIVLNSAFSTTALGTAFYVHAPGGTKNYSIELLEGKVKLSANNGTGKLDYLNAGEEGQWQQAESKFTRNSFDTLQLKQWLSGKISFTKTPVQEAIKQLEKWYDIEIDVQRKNWGKLSITGDYVNVPLDDILKVICFSLSGQYSYSDHKIIIQ